MLLFVANGVLKLLFYDPTFCNHRFRGWEAIPKTQHIIVVARTAFAMKGDEARAREACCDGYITKSIDQETY